MTKHEQLPQQLHFVAEYAARLMGCGIHTSRVIRNTKRIGEALRMNITISVFSQRSLIITVKHPETEQVFSEVVEIQPLAISFKFNSELSALSWEAYDEELSFEQISVKYQRIISEPRMHTGLLLALVGLANASFCWLFKGDWISMLIVCIATIIGFWVRLLLQKRHVNHYIVFIISAFVASMLCATSLWFKTTSDIAMATSVLYLIPGVPLINGVIDLIEGHTLTGVSRLLNAFLLIVCIAIGLSMTLFIFNNQLI